MDERDYIAMNRELNSPSGGELSKYKTMSQLFDYIETLTGHRCTERQLDEIRQIVVGMDKPEGWLCPVLPKDIPNIYQWVAMDENGDWYAYELKPEIGVTGFYLMQMANVVPIAKSYYINFDWQETLKEIPR